MQNEAFNIDINTKTQRYRDFSFPLCLCNSVLNFYMEVLCIIVLMAAAGGGWFFMQTKKKKKAESAPDPDADYTDEDDEDYGAGTDTEDIDSYDVGDPYEDEILDDSDGPADDGEEDV